MNPNFVETLNARLLQQLGPNPMYRWMRGGDLWVCISMKHDDGSQAYEEVQTPTGLWVSVPVSRRFDYADAYRGVIDPQTFNRAWVLCVKVPCLLTPDQWRTVHPGVPYMAESWTPTDLHGRTIIQLTPTMDQTEKIIRVVKMNREQREKLKTFKDVEYEDNKKWRKDLNDKYQKGADMGRESLLAGQLHTPGKKDNVSLPSVGIKKEEVIQ